MTSSRLNASTSSLLRWGSRLILAGLAALVVALPSVAQARRRIVILDFEGPKAEQFHVDVERLVKKQHMVIPVDKWNAAAEEMDATSLSEKDVKKVAKRLNVDGVISGKIEKRRDEYILRLKVREGKTGEVVGNPIDTKTGGPRLDGAATREIKTELFDTLDVLDTGGGGGDEEESGEEEAERPRKFVKRGGASEEEEGEEEAPAKGKKNVKGKKGAEEEEEAEEVVAKPTKGKKGAPVAAEEEETPEVVAKPTKGKKGAPVAAEEEEIPEVVAKPTKGKKGEPPVVEEVAVKPTKGKKGEPPVVEEVAVKPTKGTETAVAIKGTKPTEPVKPTKETIEPKGKPAGEQDNENPLTTKPTKGKPDLFASVGKKEDPVFVPKTKTKTKVKAKAKPKAVAVEEEGDNEGISDTFEPAVGAQALNQAHRAIDITAGMSFTSRRLRFKSSGFAAPSTPPRSYDTVPVAGFTFDGEAYPLAYGHKKRGPLTNIGLTAMFDRTFRIRTRLRYTDPGTGMAREKELQSTYQRYAIGATYRHNLGSPEKPLMVTGGLRFGSQSFSVDRGGVDAKIVDIPDVKYVMIEPSAGIKYAVTPKIGVGAEVSLALTRSIGAIQSASQYGPATVTGFEGDAFLDYLITDKIFARAGVHAETIGMKFKGYGALSNMRDADADQEVRSARDTYLGGALTAGYLF
jgi:hypothetical protein